MTRLSTIRFLSGPALLLLATGCGGCYISIGGSHGVQLQKEAQRQETRALELGTGDTLTLDTSYGDIQVSIANDGRSELSATLHASGRTQEEADAVLARYQLAIERGPHGPVARLAGEPLRLHEGGLTLELSAHVDFVARVPAGTALVASSESGDVRASGPLGACKLETSYGGISLEDVHGDVSARSSSGDVRAKSVDGATLALETSYGDVHLADARATSIALKSGSGDIELDTASAQSTRLTTDYGNVHARELGGDLQAYSGSGDVRLHGVRGAIDAKSDYGEIEIDGVLTSVTAKTGSGGVDVRAREGSRADTGWTLASSYGGVTLRVPASFGCRLDARTSYGEVECDFSVQTEAGKKKEGSLRGTVGSGGGNVTLSSSSGNVALKKL